MTQLNIYLVETRQDAVGPGRFRRAVVIAADEFTARNIIGLGIKGKPVCMGPRGTGSYKNLFLTGCYCDEDALAITPLGTCQARSSKIVLCEVVPPRQVV